MSIRPRHLIAALGVALIAVSPFGPVALTGGAVAGAAVDPIAVINADGGNGLADGLRIAVGNGQFQVYRGGEAQIYWSYESDPSTTATDSLNDGFYLDIDGTLYGATSEYTSGEAVDFSNVTTTGGSASGGGSIDMQMTADVAGDEYLIDATFSYVYPNDYLSVTSTVTPVNTNTADVRFYVAIDSYLVGGDEGPGFWDPTTSTVGVAKSGVVEAIRYDSGAMFDNYYSAHYGCMWGGSIFCPDPSINSMDDGEDFDDTIDADPTTDNGFGVSYHLGTGTTPLTTAFDLVFVNESPTVTASWGAPQVQIDTPTTLTLTVERDGSTTEVNGPFDLAVEWPAGVRLFDSVVSNTCGGAVGDYGTGDPLPGADDGFWLQGGELGTGVSSCAVTVNVTSATAQTAVVDHADIYFEGALRIARGTVETEFTVDAPTTTTTTTTTTTSTTAPPTSEVPTSSIPAATPAAGAVGSAGASNGSTAPAALAFTGSNGTNPAVLALVLMAAGGLALLCSRRKFRWR